MDKIIQKALKYFLLCFAFVAIMNVIIIGKGETKSEADSLLNESREKRILAMKAHCDTVGKRISTCYAEDGSARDCEQMKESVTWFTSEYNQIPEIACSKANVQSDYDFLVLGQ